MQSEFYTRGAYGEEGLQPFDMQKALTETPDYVVFNGAVGAMVGDNAMTANVGETVRLFVGNGGPNLVSSFHVIGEIFDSVYVEGGDLINHNVQTTLIPAGGAAIVEFKVEVPGTLIVVDHSIFRAFNKGALAMINVEGAGDPIVYSGKQQDSVYLPEGGGIQTIDDAPTVVAANNKSERILFGERVYQQNCAACHQSAGTGIPGAFPPLAGSDFLLSDPQRAISILLNGLSDPITVNGQDYKGVMPAVQLSDEKIANVLSYILNSWNNNGGEITPQQVGAKREH
jgi:nitrite reductase (NO-forming)